MFSRSKSVSAMKTLLIDNYDSFSHILFQYLWEVNGEKPLFIRNDEWTLAQILAARFDNLVISPGPGHPGSERDFGICAEAIRACAHKPLLGVCLGLQGLGLAAGGRVGPAPAVRHGKPSPIRHDGKDLFAGVPQGFQAVRYHSLVIDPATAPPGLVVTATAADDGQIMGIKLGDRPAFGVQFHPESIGTEHGKALLANFRDLSARLLGPGAAAAVNATVHIPSARKTAPPIAEMEFRSLPWRDPEAAFDRWFRKSPAAFWLDSLAEPVPGEARVSYMGSGTRLLEVRGEADAFARIEARLSAGVACRLPSETGFTGSFTGGLLGWFGYGLKRFAGGGPEQAADPDLPDALFLEPDRMLAFDQAAGRVYACLPRGTAVPQSGSTAGEAAAGTAWLDEVEREWESLLPMPLELGRVNVTAPAPASDDPLAGLRLSWSLSASRPEYLDRIRELQQAILRGETYEACLTNELRAECEADPFDVYRLLRRTNPAPYAAYLRFPGMEVLSASPERFLKLDARGNLASRPIKGTRPRGADAEADAALRAELAGNAKDRSENLMIVDLVRNDFGKVCALGTVAAPEMMKVETHPNVLQLVSTVTGRLAEGETALSAVRACFPGGSMTGAPKKRTMELLAAAERRPRGIFSGAMGYLGFDGAMDLGMVIRTLVHVNGEYRVGCGGAILSESDPEAEFAEAMLKAAAPMHAVELAVFGSAGNWKTGR